MPQPPGTSNAQVERVVDEVHCLSEPTTQLLVHMQAF
jgi:hypothetical protein